VPGAVVDQADGFIVHQALVAEFAEAVGLFDGREDHAAGHAGRGVGFGVVGARREVDLPLAVGGVFVALDNDAGIVDDELDIVVGVVQGVVE